ncbi:response regulator [Cohnella zeiphila]|uniref:Response regulator n=1 Tax=Cohnella zeiphila TaxID=2761120 RepID=A0A7X0SRA7_9BACL|nr:response regulator [Cohnella zeiphila]MBB6734717.1 response regulator [Cohnella zeiphila]
MYKVLIVDDEYYFRQALKVTLPWEELGFRIAGEAKNGEEALARMAEWEPDIVLVDINMPIMDGIDFIQNVRGSERDPKFIVLTGHNEFAYAKQAVQLGVFNYVLKPINEEELRDSLLDLKNLIQKERSAGLELEELKKQAKENLPVLKERFLNKWLQGQDIMNPSKNIERLKYLGINLDAPCYAVIVLEIDSNENIVSEENKQIYKLAVQDIAQERIPENCVNTTCYDMNDRFVIIIGMEEDSGDRMESLCEMIRQSVQARLPCTVTIGVGNGHRGLESISVSYQEALYALKHRFVLGGNQVILHSMISESGMKASLFTLERRSNLLMCLRIGDLSETEAWITAFFRDALDRNASMEMFLLSGLEIVSTCLEFLDETSQSFERIFPEMGHRDLFQQIGSLDSIGRLESWTRTFILKVMKHVQDRKQSRTVKVVEEVKAYIQDHYRNEDLRIEDIAKYVNMNYNHLCYVFKKETSVTINDYLTELRIKKAKDLFDQGIQVVQYVASQVGYADSNYFSKCFRKYLGISPSKYIHNIQ